MGLINGRAHNKYGYTNIIHIKWHLFTLTHVRSPNHLSVKGQDQDYFLSALQLELMRVVHILYIDCIWRLANTFDREN